MMSWPLVIAVLIAAPLFTPCSAMQPHDSMYRSSTQGSNHHFPSDRLSDVDDFFEADHSSSSSSSRSSSMNGDGRSTWAEREGGMDALRSFASTRATKTGTTIAGVAFKGGVVLGADTRATGGKTVCDRNCDKIHILASNIACCGAGTSADAERITEGVHLALLRMAGEMQACLPSRGTPSSGAGGPGGKELTRDSGVADVQRQRLRVAAAAFLVKRHLFRYRGTVSAAFVLGGVDAVGEHLYELHNSGSYAEVEFTAVGSGSLAALGVLERGHREDLGEEEAKRLVMSAIAAGIENDLGSGSNIDVCVITAERGLEHHRGAWKEPDLRPEGNAFGQRRGDDGAPAGNDDSMAENGDREGDSSKSNRSNQIPEPPSTATATTSPRRETSSRGQMQPGMASSALEASADVGQGQPGADVGGEGGSRAWVGSVRRRDRRKSVLRVDGDSGALRSFRCSAMDDTIELL